MLMLGDVTYDQATLAKLSEDPIVDLCIVLQLIHAYGDESRVLKCRFNPTHVNLGLSSAENDIATNAFQDVATVFSIS